MILRLTIRHEHALSPLGERRGLRRRFHQPARAG